MEDIFVIKRNGNKEKFDFSKIENHINYAINGFDVDKEKIVKNFKIRLKPKMYSKDIQTALIYSASDLIDENNEDMQYIAARLLLQDIYKNIYNSHVPIFNSSKIKERIEKGIYDNIIFQYYTEKEIDDLIKETVKWENDYKFTYLGLTQMTKKYGLRYKGKLIETPQEIFFLIPLYISTMILKDGGSKEKAKKFVKKGYKLLSNFDVFLSTPPMVGIRTKMRGYTSCCGIHAGDSIFEFGKVSDYLFKLITKLRAGVGLNPGLIRGIGADIGDGMETHTGITGYLKVFESISRSSQQPSNGRSGAITNYYPFFHWEIEDIIQLKNNKGSEEKKIRFSDHAVVFNRLFLERYFKDKNITLFYMNDVGSLYEKIGNYKEFKKYYEMLEKDSSIQKKHIKAKDLLRKVMYERYGTARIYYVNADEMDSHSAFTVPVYTSNLCMEIELPSFPLKTFKAKVKNKKEFMEWFNKLKENNEWYHLYKFLYYKELEIDNEDVLKKYFSFLDENGEEVEFSFGEIFSCILGGINFGNLSSNKEKRINQLQERMDWLVEFLDLMIDMQEYQGIVEFENFTKKRRALGISPGNYFYFLAKNRADYDTEKAKNVTHEIFEEMLYTALRASNKLAKEKGKCEWFGQTKYSKGILPIDTYNRNVDSLHNSELKLDWDILRKDIVEHGLRNSTLLTIVPSSNSSRPANMISGINPPQGLLYNVEDNNIKIQGVLPEVKKYRNFYEKHKAWNLDVLEYWKLVAIMQKFVDQSISLNEYVDFTKYKNEKIPEREAVKRFMFMFKYGLKTLYYAKTKTSEDSKELEDFIDIESSCGSGGCTL